MATINDVVRRLQEIAAQDLKGGEAEVTIYDGLSGEDYREFQITRGDGEAVIELN